MILDEFLDAYRRDQDAWHQLRSHQQHAAFHILLERYDELLAAYNADHEPDR